MKSHVATAVKVLAQFFFFTGSVVDDSGPFPVTTLRVPLLVTLHSLDIPIKSVESAADPKSLAKITAHLQVRYGAFALNSFYFWLYFQILRALIKHGPDPDSKSFDMNLQMLL